MPSGGAKRWFRGVAGILIGIGSLATSAAFGVWLVKRWRSGAAFIRHRNAEGELVSDADLLIWGVVGTAAFIGALVWRWWDNRREGRVVRDIRERQQARPKPPV